MNAVKFKLNGTESFIEVAGYADIIITVRDAFFSKDDVFKIEITEIETDVLQVVAVTPRGTTHSVGYIFDSIKQWMKDI
ncbi:hypothetical protein [Sphingobacterium multivorum]|uniref:hypothetical protein n=1 Tax=Sphingobacterium multivorum TaxID=28454 RepID=UPI0028A99593|nr:hypothetical protein [Sphingobacterium multivorum]